MAKPSTIKVARSDRYIVPPGLLSYPVLVTPKSFKDEGDPKYGCNILVKKGEGDDAIKAIKALQVKATKDLFGADKPENFEVWGIADGDKGEDPYSKGHWIITAKNKLKPKVIDKKGSELLDLDEMYAGCKVRASIQAKAYGSPNKGGVTLELLVVQKVGEGTPFSEAAKKMNQAADEMGAFEADDDEYPF